MTNPLTPLYDAVAWVMQQIHAGLSHVPAPGQRASTWVLTIVILVVLMRLILVPLFIKQMHATRKMTALAPQIQELRKKYKNDKQTLNQETMKLYQENGANPLAGCLPLLGQMPLFFALFSVLRAISDWKPGEPPPYGLSHVVRASARSTRRSSVPTSPTSSCSRCPARRSSPGSSSWSPSSSASPPPS